MSFYVVGEYRLFPGRTEQYLDAIRQIVQIWANAAGCYTHSVYLGRDDPNLTVTVTRWRHPSDQAAARAKLPAALANAVNACVEVSLGEDVWYETARETEKIGLQATVATCGSSQLPG